jgi:hypothetical protein
MTITATTMMMVVLAALNSRASVLPDKSVTVCMERGSAVGEGFQARAIASKIFAAIEVTINWHVGLDGCPARSIRISLCQITPKSERPGAYAYALPYEGSDIVVYYDRISAYQVRTAIPTLLAHVLVHEITHILEGIARHSDSGIMKARWDDKDFVDMAWRPLKFTQGDIDLIHAGLVGRAAYTAVAMN